MRGCGVVVGLVGEPREKTWGGRAVGGSRSSLLGRLRLRSTVLRESLGWREACESVAGFGTAGTGMNCKYGSSSFFSGTRVVFCKDRTCCCFGGDWMFLTGAPGTAGTAIRDGGRIQPSSLFTFPSITLSLPGAEKSGSILPLLWGGSLWGPNFRGCLLAEEAGVGLIVNLLLPCWGITESFVEALFTSCCCLPPDEERCLRDRK